MLTIFSTLKKAVVRFFSIYLKYHSLALIDFLVAILLILATINSNGQSSRLERVAILILGGYLTYTIFNTVRIYRVTSQDIQSGYSICLDKPLIVYRDKMKKQVETLSAFTSHWEIILNHFRVLDTDWQYYDGSRTAPIYWQNNITDITTHFFRYANLLPRQTSMHIFLMMPPSMALGIGHTIGKNRKWNIHQYHQSDSYDLLTPRSHQNTNSGSLINVQDSSRQDSSEVVVVLSFTYIDREYIRSLGNSLVEVSYRYSNRRIENQHFYGVAEEISQLINTYLNEGKRVKLYAGLPTCLAFILGSQIEAGSSVGVHNLNHDTKQWESVFWLNQLNLG